MMTNVNCQCVSGDACLHYAAPRPWFGLAKCVLIVKPKDQRLRGCALQYPYTNSIGKRMPPPCIMVREGRKVQYKMPSQMSINKE